MPCIVAGCATIAPPPQIAPAPGAGQLPIAYPTATPTPAPPVRVASPPAPSPSVPVVIAVVTPGPSATPRQWCPVGTAAGVPCALESTRPDGHVAISLAGNSVDDLTVDFTLTGANLAYTNLFPRVLVPAGQRVQVAVVGPYDATQAWNYHYDFSGQRGDYQADADATLYHLPYAPGTSHPVVQGWNGTFSHQGIDAIDWQMPSNTPIYAARAGLVVETRSDVTQTGTDPSLKDTYPVNAIYIRHDDGTLGVYLHLVYEGVEVVPGQRVATGQRIGRSGNTGYSSGPHLHFEVQAPGEGTSVRTFPVLFQTRAGATTGEQPLEGHTYTAF